MKTPRYEMPQGRVILRERDTFYIADGDGNHLQRLGRFSGTSAWSPDGRFIAIGCQDITKICILDASTICDRRKYPSLCNQIAPDTIREIELPDSCQKVVSDAGILSISWSFDGLKLAVVCGQSVATGWKRQVCILPLEGEPNCWENELRNGVNRAVWSPKENVLAISAGQDIPGLEPVHYPKTYIVDEGGKNPEYLADGWSPEWSPDGKQVALIKWGDDRKLPGIAVVDKDGANMHWVYQSRFIKGGDTDDYSYIVLFCENDAAGCRLSWSPDGYYIVFSAKHGPAMYDYQTFRLDLRTGEIILLTYLLSDDLRFFEEPDWGP